MASLIKFNFTTDLILKSLKNQLYKYENEVKNLIVEEQKQQRTERANLENWLSNTIVNCTGKLKKPVDNFKLSEINKISFYDPKILNLKKCMINAWTPFPKDQKYRSMKLFWRNQTVLASGSYGVILNPKDRDLSTMFVIKNTNTRTEEYINAHEMFIMLILNRLRIQIPNFVYGFGYFMCSQSYFIGDDERSLCDVDGDTMSIVMEKINGETFFNNIKNGLSLKQILNYYLQVLFALEFTKAVNFSHNDLHTSNVILRPIQNSTIEYIANGIKYYLKTDKIATIIDFGISYLHIGNAKYGPYSGGEGHGVYPDVSNRLMDSYKLFMFILKDLLPMETSIDSSNSSSGISDIDIDLNSDDSEEDIEILLNESLDEELIDVELLDEESLDERSLNENKTTMNIIKKEEIIEDNNMEIFYKLEPIFRFFFAKNVNMIDTVKNGGIFPLPKINTIYRHLDLIRYINKVYNEIDFITRKNPGKVLKCEPLGNIKCIKNDSMLYKKQTYNPIDLFYKVRISRDLIPRNQIKDYYDNYEKTNVLDNSFLREQTIIKQLNLIMDDINDRYGLSKVFSITNVDNNDSIEIHKFSNLYSMLLILRDINIYNYFYLKSFNINKFKKYYEMILINTSNINKIRVRIRRTSNNLRIKAIDNELSNTSNILNYMKSSRILEQLFYIQILTSWDMKSMNLRLNLK